MSVQNQLLGLGRILCGFLCLMTFANGYLNGKGMNITDLKVVATADNTTHFDNTLAQILKQRVVGSKNHENVKQFIIDELESMEMNVDLDRFRTRVPVLGNVTFTNIIGTVNANADAYLTLACHYDSKYFPNEYFVAAIDSAVPCAMMLNLVKTLQPALKKFSDRNDISLMLLFFDGEEAFRDWTKSDSLYGSRHLANKWGRETFQLRSQSTESIRNIDRIEVMVLLDLIGAVNQKFYSFYKDTEPLHNRLYQIEQELLRTKMITGPAMFQAQSTHASIDDDHRPFKMRNVPILHVIPIPFPDQWHKPEDNFENLSPRTITNFNRIIRVFVLEYLQSHSEQTNFRTNF